MTAPVPSRWRPAYIRPVCDSTGRLLCGYVLARCEGAPLQDSDILIHYGDPRTPGREIAEDAAACGYLAQWGAVWSAPGQPPQYIREVTPGHGARR